MRTLFLAPLAALALAGCTQAGLVSPMVMTPTGKTQVSLPLVGSDMVRAASLANIAADAVVLGNGNAGTLAADVHTAAAAVQTAGTSLETSAVVTGDGQANLAALKASLTAMIAGVGAVNADIAAKAKAAMDAVNNALTLAQAVPVAVPAAAVAPVSGS